jgi:hypothetical protein
MDRAAIRCLISLIARGYKLKIRTSFLKAIFVLAGALCLLFCPVSSKADTVTYTLTTGNSGLAGFTGPFAQVTVEWTSSTTANITFTSLTNGGYIYLMGDGSSAAVNVNGTFTLTNVSATNSLGGFTPGSYTVVDPLGSSNVDGFGPFNGVIDSFDGFTHSADKIVFTLTNISGSWSTASEVLIANAQGYEAASHIFIANSDGTNTGFTGYAANGTVPVPEPGIFILLGIAMGAIGIASRYVRKF